MEQKRNRTPEFVRCAEANWRSLCADPVVTQKKSDPKSLAFFAGHLNKSIPITPEEHGMQQIVQMLYSRHRAEFREFIHRTNSYYLTQFIGGGVISEGLQMSPDVRVSYNPRASRYVVCPHGPRERHVHEPAVVEEVEENFDNSLSSRFNELQMRSRGRGGRGSRGRSSGQRVRRPEPAVEEEELMAPAVERP